MQAYEGRMSAHEYGYLGGGRRMDMRIRNKEEKNKNKQERGLAAD